MSNKKCNLPGVNSISGYGDLIICWDKNVSFDSHFYSDINARLHFVRSELPLLQSMCVTTNEAQPT